MNTLAVYVATRWERRQEARVIASRLRHFGVRVTSRWLTGEFDEAPPAKCAEVDLLDIADTHGVLLLADGEYEKKKHGWSGGGASFEAGFANGRGLHVWVIGPKTNVFHHLPHVHQYATLAEWEEAMLIHPPPQTADGQAVQPVPGARR